MKRGDVLDRLKQATARNGLRFAISELSRHSAVTIGTTTRTLGRHSEIDDLTAKKFWEQFAGELGKG